MEKRQKKQEFPGCLWLLLTVIVGFLVIFGFGLLIAVIGGGVDASYGIFLIPIFIILGAIFGPLIWEMIGKN